MATKDLLPPRAEPPTKPPERPPVSASPGAAIKKRRSSKTKWWISAAAVVAIALTVWMYSRGSATVTYQTAAVDRGDIEATVTATGSCNAVTTVQVGSQVSGNIVALYADFNSKVKKGELIARIDPAIFQARVDQAAASLESAKAGVVTAQANEKKAESDIANAQANVANQKANVVRAESAVADAKIKYERRIQLLQDKIIAQEDLDTAKATYDQAIASLEAAQAAVTAAQAEVASAQAQRQVVQTQLEAARAQVMQTTATLTQAQLDLAHTNIYAPVDGTVVSRNMDVGQTVAASFQAPTIFQIAQDLTKMQVDTNVDESDVAPIRVGQRVAFTVDAYPGVIFHGEVSQIRKAPINVQNVITYDVVVKVDNTDLKLFPGMTANVKIITSQAANALRIPVAALRFRPATPAPAGAAKGGQPRSASRPRTPAGQTAQTVYVLEHGVPAGVHVELGITDGNYVQVLKGLTEGQRVITGTASKTTAAQPQTGPGMRRFGF
jgi:HlyD family secretion protein